MDFYSEFSRYYDYIFPFKKEKKLFLKKKFNNHNKLLDIGTGTGTYALSLAREDFEVTGIDLDPEMLLQARRKKKNELKAKFVQEDMRKTSELFSSKEFDGIYSLGNVLVHLNNKEDILQLLKDCNLLLVPEGRILIQIINYDRVLDNDLEGLPTIYNEEAGVKLVRNYEEGPEKNTLYFSTRLIIEKDGENKEFKNRVPLLALRSQELFDLLSKAGFNNISAYGNFKGEEFKVETSQPLIVTADKM